MTLATTSASSVRFATASPALAWDSREIQGYARSYAAAQAPLFHGEVDEQDLLQEFAVCYVQVSRMADPERGPSAFMALFKNRIAWRVTSMKRALLGTRQVARKIQFSSIEASGVSGGRNHTSRSKESRAGDTLSQTRDIATVVGDKLMDTTAFADLEYGWILDEAPQPIRAMLEAKRDGTFNRLDGESGKEMIRRITGMPPSTFYEFCGEWVRSVLDGAPNRKLALT
jgi:hypothetical protein